MKNTIYFKIAVLVMGVFAFQQGHATIGEWLKEHSYAANWHVVYDTTNVNEELYNRFTQTLSHQSYKNCDSKNLSDLQIDAFNVKYKAARRRQLLKFPIETREREGIQEYKLKTDSLGHLESNLYLRLDQSGTKITQVSRFDCDMKAYSNIAENSDQDLQCHLVGRCAAE